MRHRGMCWGSRTVCANMSRNDPEPPAKRSEAGKGSVLVVHIAAAGYRHASFVAAITLRGDGDRRPSPGRIVVVAVSAVHDCFYERLCFVSKPEVHLLRCRMFRGTCTDARSRGPSRKPGRAVAGKPGMRSRPNFLKKEAWEDRTPILPRLLNPDSAIPTLCIQSVETGCRDDFFGVGVPPFRRFGVSCSLSCLSAFFHKKRFDRLCRMGVLASHTDGCGMFSENGYLSVGIGPLFPCRAFRKTSVVSSLFHAKHSSACARIGLSRATSTIGTFHRSLSETDVVRCRSVSCPFVPGFSKGVCRFAIFSRKAF